MVQLGRVYDPSPDGLRRILVDRLWPRGLSKAAAALDLWAKDLAPSHDLRKAYHAGDLDFAHFAARYTEELQDADLSPLAGDVVLLTAAKEPATSHLAVIARLLAQ